MRTNILLVSINESPSAFAAQLSSNNFMDIALQSQLGLINHFDRNFSDP